MLDEEYVIEHVNDYFQAGTYDDVWIPRISSEDRWLVITSDRGKRCGTKGGNCPKLLKRYGIRHVILSGSVHALTGIQKVNILALMWPSIIELRRTPAGSCYILRYDGKATKLKAELVEYEIGSKKKKTFFEEMNEMPIKKKPKRQTVIVDNNP